MIKWNIKQQDERIVNEFISEGIHPVLAALLYNRGFRDMDRAKAFLNFDMKKTYSPFLLPDMQEACMRIKKAIEDKEKITIYGDYDVDGITSVVVLYKYLESCGISADYYIPDRRDEGYGLNANALDKIKKNGTDLVITVDTGTTAVEEVQYAKKIGLEIIITDHHECKEALPECNVINPKRLDSVYPFKDLAGVGVVFKLISALSGEENEENVFDRYSDFTAIGTVADIMPLIDENRIIVAEGLKRLNTNPSAGIAALLSEAGNFEDEITTGIIAYRLAPRLNAAGRIGDPRISVQTLLCKETLKAAKFAKELCEENLLRQKTELNILEGVEKRIKKRNGCLDNIIVEASEKWHNGVIGIVASRIVEKYNRPCILFCLEGKTAKGSARSIPGVNIFELLQSKSEYLLKFGGHEMAAGLTLDRAVFDTFSESLVEYANETIDLSALVPVVEAEYLLEDEYLSLDFVQVQKKLEPFGSANPLPLFAVNGLKIIQLSGVSQNKHTKILFQAGDGRNVSAMFFGQEPAVLSCCEGDIVDVVCTLGENTFRGSKNLSLNLKSIRLCGVSGEEKNDCFDKYERYQDSPEDFLLTEDMKITRNDVEAVYRYLKNQSNIGVENHSALGICRRFLYNGQRNFNYCKLRFCLDVLSELALADILYFPCYKTASDDVLIKVSFNHFRKTDLNNSETFKKVCFPSGALTV